MDDRNLKFTFYEAIGNEDAPPFATDDLLVVCDGCGGAGGFEQNIDRNYIDSLSKIQSVVLPEDSDDTLVKTCFSDVVESATNMTSAYYASRIAMVRYVFYSLHTQVFDPSNALNFVLKGFFDAKNAWKLTSPPKSGSKRILPTTLIAINISNQEGKEIDVNVNWVGDSRAYLLSNDGLKILSVDNENNNTEITNYISAEEKCVCHMCSLNFKFEKPCILFVASDGIFDNVTNIELEYLLLANLAEANSMEEFKEKFQSHYAKGKTDDCTMSLLASGFSDYGALKSYYHKREAYISSFYQKYSANKSGLELINKPEQYTSSFNIIAGRTRDKLNQIIDSIDANITKKETKDLLGQELYQEITEFELTSDSCRLRQLRQLRGDTARRTRDFLLGVLPIESFGSLFTDGFINEQKELFEKFNETNNEWLEINQKIIEIAGLKEEYKNLCDSLNATFNHYFHPLEKLGPYKKANFSKINKLFFEKLYAAKYSEKEATYFASIAGQLNNADDFEQEFISTLKEYKQKLKELPKLEKKCSKICGKMKLLLSKAFLESNILTDVYNADSDYGEFNKIIREFQNGKKAILSAASPIKARLEVYYSNDLKIAELVENRLKLGEEETFLDKFYNHQTLHTLIKLDKILNDSRDSLDALYEKYKEYDSSVYSLLND